MWSGFLGVYTQGHDALLETVESVLNGIPLMGASGLGSWASGALKDTVEGFGFAPVDLAARKAVLVNSQHVLKADDSAFSARLLSAKEAALMSQGNGGPRWTRLPVWAANSPLPPLSYSMGWLRFL